MLHFTDDCLIGIEDLDAEHRYLFSLVEKGFALLSDEYAADRYERVKTLLDKLENYAIQHFAHEESYMEKIRDPELFRQRLQHASFCDEIRNFQFTDIEDDERQQELLTDLMNFMAKWLYRHILGSDIMIGKLPPSEEWINRKNPCKFAKEYQTGIPQVDEEHKELFRIVEKLHRLVKLGISLTSYVDLLGVLGELHQYTVYHFNSEEKYMESIGYEGLEAQKDAHASFISKIKGIDLSEADNDLQRYMESLVEYLLGWLTNHIMNADMKIPKMK